jgi:hypothetical protein
MAAKKNYHKPAEDPRTIGGGLKAAGRERREKLQMMINSRPSVTCCPLRSYRPSRSRT